MKILFLMHQFYPTCQYGAETYAYHLGQGLQADGHEVFVFHRENHEARSFGLGELLRAEDAVVGGLPVRRLFLNPGYVFGRGAFFYFLTTFVNPAIEQHFASYLRRLAPDVVHVHHLLYLSGGLVGIARRQGIPVVGTLHDFWYFCPNAQLLRPGGQLCISNPGKVHCGACMKALYGGRIPRRLLALGGPWFMWRDWYLRRAMSGAAALVAPSRFLRARYVEAGFRRDRLTTLDYSFAPRRDGRSTPAPAGAAPEAPSGSPVRIGYVGSLTWHKGVHVLIEALRRLPAGRATLDVYGSPDAFPDYSASLRALADDMPGVRFRGAFDHGRLDEVLRDLELLVVPSLWYENSPVVIQEALMAGLPVLASRIGSLPEKVPEGIYGQLFEPGDVDSLARALEELTADRHLLAALARNVRSYDNDFDAHRQRILDIYRSGGLATGDRHDRA